MENVDNGFAAADRNAFSLIASYFAVLNSASICTGATLAICGKLWGLVVIAAAVAAIAVAAAEFSALALAAAVVVAAIAVAAAELSALALAAAVVVAAAFVAGLALFWPICGAAVGANDGAPPQPDSAQISAAADMTIAGALFIRDLFCLAFVVVKLHNPFTFILLPSV
jgi:hypothetical protein